ncbi:hypothetical protein ACNMZ4_00800 [Aerococcus urinaeequi]|uniref:hypothetical protein n=1 Tax=Aerococcus urinaeequi TaxID=51665 RepID=UPI003AAFC168
MDWQLVIERIALNAGYIVTIFTAIKYFVLNPLEKRRKKKMMKKLQNRTHFMHLTENIRKSKATCGNHQ